MNYIWYCGNLATVQRACDLQDKAAAQPLARVREDWHSTPGVLWGVPVGAGPDAGSNLGAALIEAVRVDVTAGTNAHLTEAEAVELVSYYAEATALEDAWWWDEQGEIDREQ